MNAPAPIRVSLISHTNAGKTTLARTLLGRDVGEVRDEAHVTDRVESFDWLVGEAGERLVLCDTPGFGDSQRLARRLAQAEQPLGWFLSAVWDRWTDRAFWASQQAARHVRDTTDVVLYLVNTAEQPDDASYVEPEMRLLAWMGKPVIAVLNQLGDPGDAATRQAEADRWAARLGAHAVVRRQLPLDAFARCWVQELVLLEAIEAALDTDRRPAMPALKRAWRERHRVVFEASMRTLAESLARTLRDREPVPAAGVGQRLREAGARLGMVATTQPSAREGALERLLERLREDHRASTDELLRAHGLSGRAREAVFEHLARQHTSAGGVNEGKAAVLGGLITGSLAGLKADLAAGGLTFGAGLLAGGLIGALTAAGAARVYNRHRGADRDELAWSEAAVRDHAQALVLTYLVVAHHGRGRGDWEQPAPAAHWASTVREVMGTVPGPDFPALAAESTGNTTPAGDSRASIQTWLHAVTHQVLVRLYPEVPVDRILDATPSSGSPGAQRA